MAEELSNDKKANRGEDRTRGSFFRRLPGALARADQPPTEGVARSSEVDAGSARKSQAQGSLPRRALDTLAGPRHYLGVGEHWLIPFYCLAFGIASIDAIFSGNMILRCAGLVAAPLVPFQIAQAYKSITGKDLPRSLFKLLQTIGISVRTPKLHRDVAKYLEPKYVKQEEQQNRGAQHERRREIVQRNIRTLRQGLATSIRQSFRRKM
jgi:hypothetical protein